MNLEAIGVLAALVVALFAIGGGIYAMGQNNYRFSEEGNQREQEDKRIRELVIDTEKRVRAEMDLRFSAMLKDINGIGASTRSLRVLGDRRYHNSSLAHMLKAPSELKSTIAGMLREEIHD